MKIRLLPACFLLLMLCCAVFCCAQADVLTLPAGTLAIEDEGFYQTASLDEVVLPEGIETIGARAFAESGLTKVNLPASLTYIAPDAFDGCEGLTVMISMGSFGERYARDNEMTYQYTDLGEANPASDFKYTIADGECSIYKYRGSSTTVVIPAEINGYPVTEIDYRTFYRSIAKSVYIPDGVTAIGSDAFLMCTGLTKVRLPSSLTSIGEEAFRECSKLTDIYIPYGVTQIKDETFYECSSLTDVYIPNSVVTIGDHVFSYCTALSTISIPDSVESLGGAFHHCTNLTAISLPKSMNYLGSAFYGCSALTSISIPEGIPSIASSTFFRCYELSSIYIPESVISIGARAFYLCENLTEIKLPKSMDSIGEAAFGQCTNLTKVTMPQTLGSLGIEAFLNCENLTGHVVIPTGVTTINENTFSGCKSITSVNLPNGISTIGARAFKNCSNLTSINIPYGIVSIDNGAFNICSSLVSIDLPNGITTIGSSAFEDCSSLLSINLPDSIITIGYSAFEDCSNLISIDLPNNLTVIETNTFYMCRSLTNITIPDGITVIGSHAFRDCSSVTSITLPNSVKTVGTHAFSGCAITSIDLPNSITSIGQYAFGSCLELIHVNTPSNMNAVIKDSAFAYCRKLSHIDIPNGVTSIGDMAFYDCDKLTSISIPPSVTDIGPNAFRDTAIQTCYGRIGSYAETYAKGHFSTFIPTSFPTAVDAFQKESHSEYYEILNGYSYNGQHYFEANLLKPYNGVGANHFFFIDDEGRVVTDVETIRALWTMRMYANNENNINTILSDSTANAKIWSSSAKSFMSKEMISETSGTLIADLIASYSTAGAVFVANLLDGVANNMLDGNEMTAFLQISEIDRLLDYLDKLNNYNRSLSAKDSYGLYDYEAVNTKLRVFVNYMQAYEVTQGLCIPVIERIVSQFENETQVAFHLVGLAFWEGISTIPGVGVVTEIVESAVTGEGNISSLADEMMSLLEKMYELDTVTQSLQAINQIMGFVSQSIDTLYGINEAYILEDSPWLDVYFKTTEEILESPMYQNHLLLAQ